MTEPSAEKNKTVLIVDDENDMTWVIGRILQDAGFQLVTANTGAEGLAKFKTSAQLIPFALLDYKLPDMTGIDLLEKIKAISPMTKVLMMTAFGTPEMKRQAYQNGAIGVLDKPFRIEKMLKIIESVSGAKK